MRFLLAYNLKKINTIDRFNDIYLVGYLPKCFTDKEPVVWVIIDYINLFAFFYQICDKFDVAGYKLQITVWLF